MRITSRRISVRCAVKMAAFFIQTRFTPNDIILSSWPRIRRRNELLCRRIFTRNRYRRYHSAWKWVTALVSRNPIFIFVNCSAETSSLLKTSIVYVNIVYVIGEKSKIKSAFQTSSLTSEVFRQTESLLYKLLFKKIENQLFNFFWFLLASWMSSNF